MHVPRSRRQFHCLVLSGLAVAALAGCATQPVPHKFARPLPLTFANAQLRGQLEAQQLLQPFTTYWTDHAQREWAKRYATEQFSVKVEPEFYALYYGNAWLIKAFEVVGVLPADEKGRVRINVQAVFANPVRPAESSSMMIQDWWERGQALSWLHINTDPMLNGMKSPL